MYDHLKNVHKQTDGKLFVTKTYATFVETIHEPSRLKYFLTECPNWKSIPKRHLPWFPDHSFQAFYRKDKHNRLCFYPLSKRMLFMLLSTSSRQNTLPYLNCKIIFSTFLATAVRTF